MSKQPTSNSIVPGSITTDDILGKDVIDPSGAFIGVVDRLFVDEKTMTVSGLSVDKGFLRRGLVIGQDYIERITEHAIFLTESPVYQIKGMYVFDVNGKTVGKVSEVQLSGRKNRIQTLFVVSGRKHYAIDVKHIEFIGTNVKLKVEYQGLQSS